MPWKRPGRWWRHAITDRSAVRRAFPPTALDAIERAIAAGERTHSGQVVFAVEPALPLARVAARLSPRERALEVFGLARVWDTEGNDGVLIYLLLADRDVEIVADRGIAALVPEVAWQSICERMEASLRDARYEEGVVAGVEAVSALLASAHPRGAKDADELSNRPLVL
ncbi:MAG: TPM domain-containing protein [Burkholderiales bacterium]